MNKWIKKLTAYGAAGPADALRQLYSEYHRRRKASVAIEHVLRGCMQKSRRDYGQREKGEDANALKVRSG